MRPCDITTPFIYFDFESLKDSLEFHKNIFKESGIRYYFPLKTNSFIPALRMASEYVDGFSVSSLFEARLANELISDSQHVHFTSPLLKKEEWPEISSLCSSIAFNSNSQLELYHLEEYAPIEVALRLNPEKSFIDDARYDPCNPNSRLGITISAIDNKAYNLTALKDLTISGLHIHNNCDSLSFNPLLETVKHLHKKVPTLLRKCKWLNLGGGYIFTENSELNSFHSAIELIKSNYDLEIIVEPGASLMRHSFKLVAEVIDVIPNQERKIAVLDTSVNHMPEVFEYQFQPDILEEDENGEYSYILEGATCLAGDHFGEYSFAEPLEIGSRITFPDMGAYTMVKAHMFNGVNLPSIYELTESGDLILQKQYTYEDFKQRCGASESNESLRTRANLKSITGKRGAA